MKQANINEWVRAAEPKDLPFRQAVHTVLIAISGNEFLQSSMIMKGGVLLALGYRSHRFTRDIDFSTPATLEEFDQEDFIERLDEGLAFAVERLAYGLNCRIQSVKQEPAGDGASFPTIKTTIGYAYKDNPRSHKRLLARNSSDVIKIDYSLNEAVGNIDFFSLDDGNIRVYDIVELVAEKFRALLQQEVRKRVRAQDLYDLYHVFEVAQDDISQKVRTKILQRIIAKAEARGLSLTAESMSNEEIIRRTREGYERSLPSMVDGELPPFEEIYPQVESFYRSLPWQIKEQICNGHILPD